MACWTHAAQYIRFYLFWPLRKKILYVQLSEIPSWTRDTLEFKIHSPASKLYGLLLWDEFPLDLITALTIASTRHSPLQGPCKGNLFRTEQVSQRFCRDMRKPQATRRACWIYLSTNASSKWKTKNMQIHKTSVALVTLVVILKTAMLASQKGGNPKHTTI